LLEAQRAQRIRRNDYFLFNKKNLISHREETLTEHTEFTE